MVTFILLFMLGSQTTVDQYGQTHHPEKPGPGLTVIDFAAAWCKPCWQALPHIQKLADTKKVRVLVVCEDENVRGRDRLVSKLGLKMPVIWDDGHHWAEHYQPKGMPTTMIVDETGKVRYASVGFSDDSWQTFMAKLNTLLAEEKEKR